LTSAVFLQAAEAASKLVGLTVDYVISSPFKRCLQTSAGAVRNLLGLQQGHWLVDWQLAEVRESSTVAASYHMSSCAGGWQGGMQR
jgi:broad specificity phosphatase PhoE